MLTELREETAALQQMQDRVTHVQLAEASAGEREAELLDDIAELERRIAAVRQADADDAAAVVQERVDRVVGLRLARAEAAAEKELRDRQRCAAAGILPRPLLQDRL
jgi:hypothetical protein